MACPIHHTSYSRQTCLYLVHLFFPVELFINHDSKKCCLIDSSYLTTVNFYVNITIYFASSEYHIICLNAFIDSLFTLNHVYNLSSSWLITLIRLCTFESDYRLGTWTVTSKPKQYKLPIRGMPARLLFNTACHATNAQTRRSISQYSGLDFDKWR